MYNTRFFAGVAQLVEQLICNQPVAGSSPISSSKECKALAVNLRPFLFPGLHRQKSANKNWYHCPQKSRCYPAMIFTELSE
jgi:hypothetical protein